jgi:FixJ family two-component response regulator
LAIDRQLDIIAVVDDDPRLRESLQDLLASAGFQARLFSSAEEALQGKGLGVSSCLITDVCMPGMDGWQLQRIALADFPRLPVIVVTAQRDDRARQRALELGAFAHFYKPFDGEELLSVVDCAVQHTKALRKKT